MVYSKCSKKSSYYYMYMCMCTCVRAHVHVYIKTEKVRKCTKMLFMIISRGWDRWVVFIISVSFF